jgi:hypothetical protein
MRPLLLWIVAGLSLSSCATAFNHAAQPVDITPQFSGAARAARVRVLITSGLGTYHATLPGQFVVTPDFWTHATVKVVEPCFKPTEQELPRHVTNWIWPDLIGVAVTAGAGAVLSITGDVFDGTVWAYSKDASVSVEPVADFDACIVESRKHPALPFPVMKDPVWEDPRTIAKR